MKAKLIKFEDNNSNPNEYMEYEPEPDYQAFMPFQQAKDYMQPMHRYKYAMVIDRNFF
jgi:hypothetical protein